MIKALIVEDSPIVRKGIRLYLKDQADVRILGEAGDGPDAVAQIAAYRPDLVFLDIQMPGFDGFEVLARSKEAGIRVVVFITAHADHALRAFDANAFAYLLKPIDQARFHEVLDRVRLLLRDDRAPGVNEFSMPGALGDEYPQKSEPTYGDSAEPGKKLTRVLVKHLERWILLRTTEIDWIGSTGEYITLHVKEAAFLLRMSLSDCEARLDLQQFARIHRGTIVNLDRIREIQPRSHGDCDVVLHDATVLRLSRSYRDNLLGRSA